MNDASSDNDTIAITEVQKLYGKFYEECLRPALAQHAEPSLPDTFAEVKHSYWTDTPVEINHADLNAFSESLKASCRASRRFKKVRFYMKVLPSRQPWISLADTTLSACLRRAFRPMLQYEQLEWVVQLQWIFTAADYALHWSNETNDHAVATFCPSWSLEECRDYLEDRESKYEQPFPPLDTTSTVHFFLDRSDLPHDPATDALSLSITRSTKARPGPTQSYQFRSDDTLHRDTLTQMISNLSSLCEQLYYNRTHKSGDLKIQVDVRCTIVAGENYQPQQNDSFLAGIKAFNRKDWW